MSHTGSWVWDTRIAGPAYWSAEMCRIHGRDVSEGTPSVEEYRAMHRAEDWSGWLAMLHESIRNRKDIDFSCRLELADGLVKHLHITGRPIRGAAEEVTEIIGWTEEIGLPGVEAAARAESSQDPLRRMIDFIPALAWSCGPDGLADVFNRAWLEYTGLSEKEASGLAWAKALHAEDLNPLVVYWQSLMASPKAGQIEARLRRFDGEYRWFLFQAKPLLDESGAVVRWFGTNTDIEDRKRAENALRASELNFRLIVDTIPAMVCTMTGTGELEVVNKQILDYFGKTREELKHWGSIGAVHDDDIEIVIPRWRYSVETGEPYDIEHRIRDAAGVYRWFHVRGLPLRDGDGQTVRWYILLVNIDDRKQAEDALRESERELRELVETIPALIWRGTRDGQLDYLNQRHIDYLGLPLKDCKDGRWAELVQSDHRDSTIRRWLQSVNAGVPYEDTYRMRRADGQYRWIQSTGQPFFDAEGRIARWYGLVQDIDDRKRAEQALQESEARLRRILETMPALVWKSAPDGALEYVNQRAVDYFGQEPPHIGLDLIHPDDRAQHEQKQLTSLVSAEPWEDTYRIRRADGEYRWFHVGVAPLRDRDGRVVHWYAVNVDIHDSREMEEALRNTRRKLSAAMQIATVAQLSASIAHEINQPLAAVVANAHACAEWLARNPPNLERARVTVDRVIRDGNAVSEVVRRIRALFKQAAPAMALSDINGIIAEVLDLIADEVRDSGTRVETRLEPAIPMIVVDRVQIQQTLINLAHNALEAMSEVTDQPKALQISSRHDDAGILIQVKDSGCGITNPAAIFEPFFTTKEQGMGMGLAICRSIIEGHGGRLWATNNDGGGATFSFALPTHLDNQA